MKIDMEYEDEEEILQQIDVLNFEDNLESIWTDWWMMDGFTLHSPVSNHVSQGIPGNQSCQMRGYAANAWRVASQRVNGKQITLLPAFIKAFDT